MLGVGVDRVDYTKGILERFRGIEHFLEMNPTYQRRFTFVQIGAPSRTNIDRYQNLLEEVTAEAESHQRPLPGRPLDAHRPAEEASLARGDRTLLSRRLRVPGHRAARRHESGRQGICRLAR